MLLGRYVNPFHWSGRAPVSVSVRIATRDAHGAAVTLPADVQPYATLEGGAAGCREAYDVACYTGGTGGDGRIATSQTLWQTVLKCRL